ncbi:hypothetical protein O3M35_007378 [Rhynocoris fuscipes]|uniref:E3 ubiquitin-protein ligase listerin n=1 Tax=Rhynocoris fuscipes TaxID=488301 RepID=A0AAW1DGE2_9HEMI
MGGKKKHTAQRTKKGVMPANSGRAAELMTATLSNIKGFGECSLATNLTQISTLPLDILDPTIDPNFQVVLKKMSKKDSITRHKALTEFMNLCYESDDEAIKSALPSWIRLYGNLSLDIEHRIREAAHLAHHAVVTKVGRNLAPYIKQIAPYWFISQYDTYPPAASAASNSFKAAFPPHKLVDVIVFCQIEILEFISDNILNHSPETIGKSEKANKENLEAKYEQILISSLNGYSLYFSKVSKEHLEKVAHINTNIIASPKFWKLNKYKNGAVRAAWFSLLSAMLQFAPNLIENEQKRVSNAVLGNINDYDPVVLPKVWEAALLIVSGIKDCWQHVSMDKFFMPKFTNILAHGGQGNASFIYPNIILLLSNIPEAVMKDKITFFGKIFSSFQKGLKQPSITSSHSESEAAAQSFIECIQYLIMIYTDDTEFCLTLINQYVIDVLSNTMMDKIHQHLSAPLCCSLLQMLLHWKNNESNNDNYKKYTEEFWNKFVIVIKDNINKCLLDKEALKYLFESIIKIMDYLNNRKFKRKKDLKVKFSQCEMETEPKNEIQPTEIINESLVEDVIKAAKELTHEYFNIATNSENYEIRVLSIQQLWKITIIFKTDQLMTLMEGYEKDFCTGLIDWIKDENISTEPLIGVIFATVDNIKNENLKNDILSEFIKVRSKDAILESAKLANSYVNDTLNKWMKSPLVKEELCNLFKNLNEENISIDVILQCLKSDPTNGFIIGEDTVLALLSVLAGHLTSESASHNERLSSVIDSFFTNNNPACLRNYKGILFELLHLCFQAIINDQNMGSLFIAWRKGLALLCTILNPDDLSLLDHARVCSNFIAEHINIK